MFVDLENDQKVIIHTPLRFYYGTVVFNQGKSKSTLALKDVWQVHEYDPANKTATTYDKVPADVVMWFSWSHEITMVVPMNLTNLDELDEN